MKRKMEKPELEVVRFRTADVIATSDGGAPLGAFPLSTKTGDEYYTCLRSEADDAGWSYLDSDDSSRQFVYFHYDANAEPNKRFFSSVASNYMLPRDTYAWFQNGQWWTENKWVENYEDLDSLSTQGWWTGD